MIVNKVNTRRLALKRTAIRTLTSAQTMAVAGGAPNNTSDKCGHPPTYSCIANKSCGCSVFDEQYC